MSSWIQSSASMPPLTNPVAVSMCENMSEPEFLRMERDFQTSSLKQSSKAPSSFSMAHLTRKPQPYSVPGRAQMNANTDPWQREGNEYYYRLRRDSGYASSHSSGATSAGSPELPLLSLEQPWQPTLVKPRVVVEPQDSPRIQHSEYDTEHRSQYSPPSLPPAPHLPRYDAPVQRPGRDCLAPPVWRPGHRQPPAEGASKMYRSSPLGPSQPTTQSYSRRQDGLLEVSQTVRIIPAAPSVGATNPTIQHPSRRLSNEQPETKEEWFSFYACIPWEKLGVFTPTSS